LQATVTASNSKQQQQGACPLAWCISAL
jgi:hypothetical protein